MPYTSKTYDLAALEAEHAALIKTDLRTLTASEERSVLHRIDVLSRQILALRTPRMSVPELKKRPPSSSG